MQQLDTNADKVSPDVDRLIKEDDLVGLSLKEIGKIPLLTKDEEVALAKRIEKGREAKQKLERERRSLSNTRRRDYGRFVEDGEAARRHFIEANGLLVVNVVMRLIGKGRPIDLDLVQEGILGLEKAIEKFDWRRGFKFSTYATWWIRQTVGRAIKDKSRTIRLPVHMNDQIGGMFKKIGEFKQENGRNPVPEEISILIGAPLEKVNLMLRAGIPPISLNEPVGEEEEGEFGDFIEDVGATDLYKEASMNILRERINEVLSELAPREAKILRYRFGLADGETWTLDNLGKKFGVTRERIRQIEERALHRLRHPSRTRRLKDFNE